MACSRPAPSNDAIPTTISSAQIGDFVDDYGSKYTITDSTWTQDEAYSFHVLSWDTLSQTIVARNDSGNPTEPNRFTRIDYLELDMPPYTWAFCLTVYDAETADAARTSVTADVANPREGCSGFPFTRMKPIVSDA